MDEIVLPGEIIGMCNTFLNGENTYCVKTEIRSAILGKKEVRFDKDGNKVLSVSNTKWFVALPQVGDIVICKVYRVTFNIIYCTIILLNNKVLKNPFKGYINKSDIHLYEGELGDNFECYKQGDIIKAKVLSIAQHGSYKISTVGSDLGVILALSRIGKILKPVAWNLMINVSDMSFEKRKVSNDFSIPF
ncbi:exosome complex component CSL4 [Plasmodium gonderi]|uniref:Exosome complex component CSL4 n=1 Tax=Plasmodium gonderi TaxID=77519 RepID=A0A1Y1JA09_PLAGO|nr:exosome complex component CSL4 [Plasmodium gonderi]GAW79339.1 exosome complex component CSL4 [Plasmodium gonderi]